MEVMLIGNPGAGKTFLATCLADAACHANIKVRLTTAIDMINHLIAAEADRSLLKKLQYDQAPELLVGDELGYLSLGQQGSHLCFQVIRGRQQRKSPVSTTHLPFADWGQVFDSTTVATAIADRLVYNSAVLIVGGSSYRRKLPSYHRGRRPSTGDPPGHHQPSDGPLRVKTRLHDHVPDFRVRHQLRYLSLRQQEVSPFCEIDSEPCHTRSSCWPLADGSNGTPSIPVTRAIADRLGYASEVLITGGATYRRKLITHRSGCTTAGGGCTRKLTPIAVLRFYFRPGVDGQLRPQDDLA
jgi:hypothetical protein